VAMAGSTALVQMLALLLVVLIVSQTARCNIQEELEAIPLLASVNNQSENDFQENSTNYLPNNMTFTHTNQSLAGQNSNTNNSATYVRAKKPCDPDYPSNCRKYGGECSRRTYIDLPRGQCNVIDKTLCEARGKCVCCLGKKCKKKLRKPECRYERGHCSQK
ncbi:unnamed protein product, partial [Meganyctiphanes norvegica]